MWVITKDGFYSAVLYRDVGKDLPSRVTRQVTPDEVLVVRTRAREDAEAYVRFLRSVITDETLKPGDEHIVSTPAADYQYRVFSTRSEWASFLTHTALDIDYRNFKSAITDSWRHDIYMSVWGVLNRIGSRFRQDRRGYSWEEPQLPLETRYEDIDRSDFVRGYFQNRGGRLVRVSGYTRGRPKKADA